MGKGPYLVYGRRTVAEFFQAGGRAEDLIRVLLQEDLSAEELGLPADLPSGMLVRRARRQLHEEFSQIVHQGILLEVRPGGAPRAAQGRFVDFVRRRPGLLVVLDEVQDPQNVGAIVRSAEALGAAGLLLTPKSAPLGPTVDRASAGASFYLPIFTDVGASSLLDAARRSDYWLAVSTGSAAYADDARLIQASATERLPPAESTVLVIGNEGRGVRHLFAERADYLLTIPLTGRLASLNAGAAAAILLDRLLNRAN